jgi:Phage tail sheath C-terminal domain/Phage tail sheath protein subtilisin-like domain
MAEMVIPGTYIDVRAEGLISAGRVSVGIVGVVGTARRGPVGEPVTLSGLSNARDLFGLSDPFDRPEDGAHALTLVRALEQVYANGASTVVAVRVAGATADSATFAVLDDAGHTTALLSARTPGMWGNDIRITVDPPQEDARVEGESQTQTFDSLGYAPVVPSAQNQIRIFRGVTRRIESLVIVYKRIAEEAVVPDPDGRFVLSETPIENVATVNQIRVLDAAGEVVRTYETGDILYGAGAAPGAGEVRLNNSTGELTFAAAEKPTAAQRVEARYAVGHAAPQPGEVLVTAWDGSLDFAEDQGPSETDGDRLEASYLVDRSAAAQVTLRDGTNVSAFIVPSGRELAAQINASPTAPVTAQADGTHGGARPKTGIDAYFGSGSNTPGGNGAEAGADDYELGLESLAERLINIVVLAGQDVSGMGAELLGHLNSTEQADFERIGVIGAKGSTVPEFLGHTIADGRVVVVAPGLRMSDGTVLPPAYAAAAVAGLISSLPAQGSLTNKSLTVPGLALSPNRGEQEQLIRRNVLALAVKDAIRVVKGVTTSGEGTPFSAIPTRRIVDYAKYGVRSAANPYIGRLNNERVRAALRATLDGFLTRMVEDEALTAYELDVTATRPQEIAGEVSVVMTLQPTFSIEFIRVVMNLK